MFSFSLRLPTELKKKWKRYDSFLFLFVFSNFVHFFRRLGQKKTQARKHFGNNRGIKKIAAEKTIKVEERKKGGARNVCSGGGGDGGGDGGYMVDRGGGGGGCDNSN